MRYTGTVTTSYRSRVYMYITVTFCNYYYKMVTNEILNLLQAFILYNGCGRFDIMKILFHAQVLFDGIPFEDKYFDSEDSAVEWANSCLDYWYDSTGDYDSYTAIVTTSEGVVL